MERVGPEMEPPVQPRADTVRAELDALLSASAVAVGFLDAELRYSRVNQALAQLHGISAADLRGARLIDLFEPADARRIEAVLRKVLTSGNVVSGLEVAAPEPGRATRRPLVCCFFPIAIDGAPVGLGAILVDDSERRRLTWVAERHARELEAVIDSISEGVYIGDSDGVRHANRAALEMLGYETLDDLNRPVETLMAELNARGADGRVLAVDENVFVRALGGESACEDIVIRHRQSRQTRVVRSSAAPVRLDGSIVGAVAVNFDVTERRAAEAQLALQHALAAMERDVLAMLLGGAALERVMTALAVGLEQITASGLLASVLTVEDGKIRHVAAPSLPKQWCDAIEGEPIGPEAGSCGTAAYRRERVIVTDIETDPLWANYRDRARPFGLRACWSQPILSTAGDVLGTVALYYCEPRAPSAEELEAIVGAARVARVALERHRTDRVRQGLVDELRHTLRYNEMLIGVLGHDLRNPLSAILTGAHLVLRSETDPARRRTLERVQSSGQRMGRMIEQILDFTRARRGEGIPIDRRAIDLAEVARSVAHEVELAFPQRRLVVDITGDTHGEWDPDRLSQVLSNLLCNAMFHGNESRDVHLRIVGSDAASVAIRVENGGVIAEEDLSWLFDPFRRGVRSEQRTQGLGLGLYITRQIVLAHGGRIEVRSRAEEGTTIFSLDLPRHASP